MNRLIKNNNLDNLDQYFWTNKKAGLSCRLFFITVSVLFLTNRSFAQYGEEVLKYSKSKEDSIKSLLIGTWVYEQTFAIGQKFDTIYVENNTGIDVTLIFNKNNIYIQKVVDCLETIESYNYEIIIYPGHSNFSVTIPHEKYRSSIEIENLIGDKLTTISYINDHFRTRYIKKE